MDNIWWDNSNNLLFINHYPIDDTYFSWLNSLLEILQSSNHPTLLQITNVPKGKYQKDLIIHPHSDPRSLIKNPIENIEFQLPEILKEVKYQSKKYEFIVDSNRVFTKDPYTLETYMKLLNDLNTSENITIPNPIQDFVKWENETLSTERKYHTKLEEFDQLVQKKFWYGTPWYTLYVISKDFLLEFITRCKWQETDVNNIKKKLIENDFMSDTYTMAALSNSKLFQKIKLSKKKIIQTILFLIGYR